MTKPIVALSIYVHDQNDAITVSDADVPGVASAVLAAVQAGKDLHFNNGTNEYFIPFHAVLAVEITKSTTTVDAPVDSLCVPVE